MSDWKVGVAVAFWKRTVLSYMVLPQGQHMNANRFLEFLRDNVYPAVRQKRIARPVILMDNARYHFSQVVIDYINERNWEVLNQNPYSPDQNPCDSHGFRQLKQPLRGRRFSSREALLTSFVMVVEGVTQNKTFSGIEDLPQTWQTIIDNSGHYAY